MSKDIFDDANEMKSSFFVKGKPGDNIKGTVVGVSQNINKMNGKDSHTWEIKASGGSFHKLDENKAPVKEVTEIKDGEYWSISADFNSALDKQMKNIKIGQIIGIKFTETLKPTVAGHSPTKVMKVYTSGDMDKSVLEGVGEAVDSGIEAVIESQKKADEAF